MKIRLFIIACIVVCSLTGCARTVTQIVNYSDEMTVTVTLRGAVDNNSNRYFIVLSSDPNYKVPLPLPDVDDDAPEMIEPGTDPILGSEEAYYIKFYSSWSGYVILDDTNQYYLIKGPFVINQATTRETLSSFNTSINFSFRLERMFTIIPDQIYFDFITVPWPDGQAKIPSDHLPSTDNNISKIVGSILTVDDILDATIDASLDIINCRIEIQ